MERLRIAWRKRVSERRRSFVYVCVFFDLPARLPDRNIHAALSIVIKPNPRAVVITTYTRVTPVRWLFRVWVFCHPHLSPERGGEDCQMVSAPANGMQTAAAVSGWRLKKKKIDV